MAQISENSLRSSRRSISCARLSRRRVGHERRDTRRRSASWPVMSMRGPAEEFFVGAQLARQDAELVQLRADQLVDVVAGDRRGRVLQALGQHQHLVADGVRLEAGHDEGFAAGSRGDQAIGRDRGRVVVVRHERRQARHVAVGAVGIAGAGDELLRRALRLPARRSADRDRRRRRPASAWRRSARPLPASGAASGCIRCRPRTACRPCAAPRRSPFRRAGYRRARPG